MLALALLAAKTPCNIFLRGFTQQGLAAREEYLTQMLADTVATEIAHRTGCRVTTAADVKTLLDKAADHAMCGATRSSTAGAVAERAPLDPRSGRRRRRNSTSPTAAAIWCSAPPRCSSRKPR